MKNFKRGLFAILIILTCSVIFFFSAQNAEVSTNTSSGAVSKVSGLVRNINDNIDKEQLENTVTVIVRKSAHLAIYTILGIWLMNEANTFKGSMKVKLGLCMVFGMLYAVSDEFHQKFISGRSQELRDVCIDSIGVMIGCLLVIGTSMIVRKCKELKEVG